MEKIVYFWSSWEAIFRILVVGTITYFGIVLILRIAGNRTLSRMNTFDFILVIAMGSTFGRILTAHTVSIAEALTAFFLLVFLQFIFSFLEVRSLFFSRMITSPPILLFYRGEFLLKNMRKERVQKNDLIGIIRQKGIGGLEKIEAIVLEANGAFSIIEHNEAGTHDTLGNLAEKKN